MQSRGRDQCLLYPEIVSSSLVYHYHTDVSPRPEVRSLIGKPPRIVPMSLQRIAATWQKAEMMWIGPEDAVKLSTEDREAYDLAHQIMCHLAIQAPTKHKSGHPGGPLSAFTFCYGLLQRRDPHRDSALRISAGHLSLLAYGLQYLGGRGKDDPRLQSPQSIIDSFRTVNGLPGHVQAGIGDIPFGTGLLGKGVSNALGYALGRKLQKEKGITDVLMGDGDTQEGQNMEAARLAAHVAVDTLVVHADMNDLQITGPPTTIVAADIASIYAAMGWAILEVQNGNDPAQVEAALDRVDTLLHRGRPILVCYYTTMGHGVGVMERAANAGLSKFHGAPMNEGDAKAAVALLPPLEELTKAYEPFRQRLIQRYDGAPPGSRLLEHPRKLRRIVTTEKGSMRKDIGALHIKNLMKSDPRIVVIHGDLAESGGFIEVAEEFPDRVINGGVAEANMYMMAAGMRQAGLLPVTYTFATFGTNEARANLRLIDINSGHVPCAVFHDCTHTGLSVGEDGETAQDRNYCNLPFDHLRVWMPADSNQAAAMVERGLQLIAEGTNSVCLFSPRSGHPQLMKEDGSVFYGKEYVFEGKADMVRGKGDCTDAVTIIAAGITVHAALAAIDRLPLTPTLSRGERGSVRLLNVSCIRPLDAAAIMQAALETAHLLVIEDHNSEGGLATQVADIIADFQLPCSLRRLGVNTYFPSGPAEDLFLLAGLDHESIADAVQDEVRAEVRGGEDALVSVLHRMPVVLEQSRFGPTARPYAERLQSEKGYLEALREKWRKRSAGKFPSNEELREVLGDRL